MKRAKPNIYHKERILFRFIHFSVRLLPQLIEALPGVTIEIKKRNRKVGLVAIFPVRRDIPCDKLVTFIRKNKIPSDKYGLWVSLVSERDSNGVHVPDFAVKLLQKTGGQLDFSFTFVGYDL